MLTHFTREGGIDEAATIAHLDFLVEAGVNGVFALGTTGEFFLMSLEERKRVASVVVRGARDRIPVFVHVGANSTADTIDLARHAESIGAAGAAAVTPYFFGLSQQALIAYYEDVARCVGPDFPIYIYNIPGCAVNDLSEEAVLRLSAVPNIAGIKSSTPDFLRGLELARRARPDFDVVVGHDTAFLAALACGVRGCISGNANAIPELFAGLYRAFNAGDLGKARELDVRIAALATLMRNGRNFSYLRAALAWRGVTRSYSRPPLPNISRGDEEEFSVAFARELEGTGLGRPRGTR
jgi:4-hydroxy-tetrahydrodipicolinate synthase